MNADMMDSAERNREKLNLKPTLEFVARHQDRYEAGYLAFKQRPFETSIFNEVQFLNQDQLVQYNGPQITSVAAKEILQRMPRVVSDLACLEKVDYARAASLPVPAFDAGGNLDFKRITWVSGNEFPRPGDHPTRILIGYSLGNGIYPTALPASIHPDWRVRWLYQFHVFLHELWHKVESPRRDSTSRRLIVLNDGSADYTLQDWWNEFVNVYTYPHQSQPPPSVYASTYVDKLTEECRERDPKAFEFALAEQICEAFAGYTLGIAPNAQDVASFEIHSRSAHLLMRWLLRSKVVSTTGI